MKMVKKKSFTDRAIAFVSALVFSLTLLMFFPVGTFNVSAVEADVTVKDIVIMVNEQPLGSNTVSNNDDVEFSFNWALNKNTQEPFTNPIIIQFDFDGIELGNFSGNLMDGLNAIGTYTIENGNKIQFELYPEVLQRSEITGECLFDGKVKFGVDDIDSSNQIDVVVRYEANTLIEQKIPVTPEGILTMQKAASGNVYKEGSNYYQNYTVTINADGTSPSVLNQITDTPNELGGTFDASKGITVTTSGTVTGISDTYNSFSDISNVTMGLGSQIVLSYRMNISENVLTAGGDLWKYGNNAKAMYNNATEISSYAQPNVTWSEVKKTGSQPDSNGYITWTVTINHNGFTGDPAADRLICSSFSDSLTGKHNFETGAAPTLNDIITNANYGETWEQKYTYTYRTKIEEENTTADRSYKNTIKVTLDGTEREVSDTVTVAGFVPVEKAATAATVDSNKKMSWEVKYTVPSNTTALTITDIPTATSGKNHALVSDSVAVTVNGAASDAYTISGNDIIFNQSVLTENNVIVITYQTLASGDFTTEGSFNNKVKAVYTQNDETIEKQSNEASYPWDVINAVEKSDSYHDNSNVNKLVWQIKINLKEIVNAGYTLKAGDIITLDDVMTCSDASAPMPSFTEIYYKEASNASLADECLANLSINDAKNKFTFKITQNMIDGGLEWFTFRYRMDFDNINAIKSTHYTNTVTATYTPNGGNVVPAGTASKEAWIQPDKSSVINKYLDTANMSTGNIVPFKIEINKSELDLSSNLTDTVTLTDTLGEILYFIPSTLVVTDGRTGTPLDKALWSYKYDNNTRKLTITLPDSRYCIVTYSVEVDTNYNGGTKVNLTLPNEAVLECTESTYVNNTNSWSATLSKGNASLTYTSGSFIVNKGDFENNNILLDGASFRLVPGYFDTSGLFTPFTDKVSHPTIEKEIVSSQGKDKIENLELEGILYQMTEIAAPTGYKIDPSPRYIVIKKHGEDKPAVPNNINNYPIEYLLIGSSLTISNEKATVPEERFPVQFKKVDAVSNTALAGATLSLYNADNVIVDTWETTSSVYTVNNLLPGTYKLVETEAPDGYEIASPITFVLSDNGTVSIGGNTITDKIITMEDEPSVAAKFKVKFQKLINNTTTPLAGATLQLKNKATGIIVDEWNSTTDTYELELEAGTYILSESKAPVGYKTAADIEFVVSDDGTVKLNGTAEDDKTIEMYDDIMLYSVKFRKTDSADKNLAGAHLQLLDSDDNLIAEWDTTDMIRTVEDIPAGTYILREESAPTGYIKAADIKFTIAADGTITRTDNENVTDKTIVMIDETETNAVTVKKIWNDADNQDGKRPEELKVTLSNGTEVTLNEANKWTATVKDLPMYADGKEIKYTWTEGQMPDGYSLTNTSVTGTVTTLTNSYTPETTEATVKKVWNDADNQDGKRPAELKVTLSNGTEVTLNEDNKWTATIKELPKYKDGKEIKYTWTESVVPEGYELIDTQVQGTVTTLTNKHTPELTSATIVKVWDDNDNSDGARPESITVTLSNGTIVILSENNNWKTTVNNLPKYANGQPVDYTWSEVVPEHYTMASNNTVDTITTITNKHTPEFVTVSGTKTWDDDNDQQQKRPEKITINLYGNNKYIDRTEVSSTDNWKYSFNNLPKYENGKEIVYTIAEDTIYGYTPTYNGYNITNKYTYPEIAVQVTKEWDDNNNYDGMRPDEITVNLLADGVATGKTATLNAANGWKYVFEKLPAKNPSDQLIKYTVTENAVEHYTTEPITGNVETGFVITNKYTPQKTSATVKKVWDDNNNQFNKRPENLDVILSNGERVTLNAGNNWTAQIDNLPMYADGKLVKYTWQEAAMPEGYELTKTETNGNVTTLTNTYRNVETVEATVKKVWDDNNNADNKRPESLTVTLSDGTVATLNEANNWTVTMLNLPKYDASGAEIAYTWTEGTVPDGYSLTSTVVNSTVTTLTNTYTKQPDTSNPVQPAPPSIPTSPSIPSTSVKPVLPIKPEEEKPEEDVSSESGIGADADSIGNIETNSYSYLAILLAVTAGGIAISRRRQKK